MISRVDHVAIAVRDYASARHFFEEVLGAVPGADAEDAAKKFYWQTFVLGDMSRIELLTPTEEGSFLDGFLKTRPGGFHHITLQTPDLEAAIAVLEQHGIPYFGKHVYPDGTWKEVFVHPRDAFGVLVQIAEFRAEDWQAEDLFLPEGKRWEVEANEDGCTLIVGHPGGGKVRVPLTQEEAHALGEALMRA